MKRTVKNLLSVILAVTVVISTGTAVLAGVALPSFSKSKPLVTYTYNSSGKVYAYSDANLTKKLTNRYIACATDECKITQIKGDAVYVTYPTSSGTNSEWFRREDFTYRDMANNGAKSKITATTKITTYRWKNNSKELGYISKGDTYYVLRGGDSNDEWTQVIYPISNGYKMGWIKTGTSEPQATGNYASTLSKMMDGSLYNGAYKLNTKYSGEYANEQCKGFAKSVHKKLFGYNIGSTKSNNYQISYSSSNTTYVGSVTSMSNSSIKALLTKARAGDFIQMKRKHGGPHSAIVYAVSSTAITFYEANIDGNNGIVKKTYTWENLCSSNAAMSLYTAKKY